MIETETRFAEPLTKLTKDLKLAASTLSFREARFLVDDYYLMQDNRMRAAKQLADMSKAGEPSSVLTWATDGAETLENEIKKSLKVFAASHVAGRWAMSITGIGPVLAAGLLAHIDIGQAPTCGHIWRFAGLDPTDTWDKGEKRPWNAKLKTLCVPAGERVRTERGYVPIEQVRVGDSVLTHQGRFRRVSEVFERTYDGMLTKPRAHGLGNAGPWLTSGHPVYARQQRIYSWVGDNGRRDRWTKSNPRRQANAERAQIVRDLVTAGVTQRLAAATAGVSEGAASNYVHGRFATLPITIGWVAVEDLKVGWDVSAPALPMQAEPVYLDIETSGMIATEDGLIAEGRWPNVAHPKSHAIPARVEIDYDLAYVIGLYLAEGHVSGNYVGWSFNEKETSYVVAVQTTIQRVFGLSTSVTHNAENHSQQVIVGSKALAQTFALFGKGAWEKHLPETWILHLRSDLLERVIDGVFDGDGYPEHTSRMLTTVSKTLAIQMFDAIRRCGREAGFGLYHQVWKGTEKDVWKVRDGLQPSDGWYPIKALQERQYAGQVFNLEIEEDHSYVVEGLAVHNCWKIGESFVMVSNNPKDFYGHLWRARKEFEQERNDRGELAEQAKEALARKKYGKDTIAYSFYIKGMLPPAHIHARARRWAVKLFLAGFHHVLYESTYGTPPPKPYILTQPGHAHEIRVPNWPVK